MSPTLQPSSSVPTRVPSQKPTTEPTSYPSQHPSISPSSSLPSKSPSTPPTADFTGAPSTSPTSSPSLGPPVPLFNINVGDIGFTDSNGLVWIADNYNNDVGKGIGSLFPVTVPEGIDTDPIVYMSVRRVPVRKGDLVYNIPVDTSGTYRVVLHFAEIEGMSDGGRTFNLRMEEVMHHVGYEIKQAAGGNYIATTVEMMEYVSDGKVTIRLEHDNEKIILSGIQLYLIT